MHRFVWRRLASTSTPYVPAASLPRSNAPFPLPPITPPPTSPAFYTARSQYFDTVAKLEAAQKAAKGTLQARQLLPLPEFAMQSLGPNEPTWRTREEMTELFGNGFSNVKYRRTLRLLNSIKTFHRIAVAASQHDLTAELQKLLSTYERSGQDAQSLRNRRPIGIDEHGRAYAVGRRKTSSARVWVIPRRIKDRLHEETEAVAEDGKDSLDLFLDKPESSATKGVNPALEGLPVTEVIVNAKPISEYFGLTSDRERVLRPLKLAGVLGRYNIFAIARGGGVSAQAGAVQLGVAKALMAYEPAAQPVFRAAKVDLRDPRMVERKKTGMAKARKRYAWVKR